MMRRLAIMTAGALLALACGHDDDTTHGGHGGSDGAATCDEVAAAAATECGATFDEADCLSQCAAQNHPAGHLDAVQADVDAAADCAAVLQVLADEAICS